MITVLSCKTIEELFATTDRELLLTLRTYIQIEKSKLKIKTRRDSSRVLKEVQERNQVQRRWLRESRDKIATDLRWFGFSLEQLKMALTLIHCIPNLKATRPMLKEWMFPTSSKATKSVVCHSILVWSYHRPSTLLWNLINKNKTPGFFFKSVFSTNKHMSQKEISKRLERYLIPDIQTSLPSSCDRFSTFYFLNDMVHIPEILQFLTKYDLYAKSGHKVDLVRYLIEHTNVTIFDFIDMMDFEHTTDYGIKRRQYFSSRYGFGDTDPEIDSQTFKKILKSKMEEHGHRRTSAIWWDEKFWGKRPRAKDGTACDSEWEVQVHDFLCELLGYSPFKPTSASIRQYYTNSEMFPDWVIDGVMVELFGAEHLEGYLENVEKKKETNILPLISISRSEYERNRWRKKLARELGRTGKQNSE